MLCYGISMTLEIPNKVYTREATEARLLGGYGPFAAVAGFVLLALIASSTPTPLYSIYAAEWGFSPLAVTEVYAVYAIGVLVALLLTGGLSDLIGRRPVMISALLGLIGAEVVFMFAGGLEWLYARPLHPGPRDRASAGRDRRRAGRPAPAPRRRPGGPRQRHRQRRRHRPRRAGLSGLLVQYAPIPR